VKVIKSTPASAGYDIAHPFLNLQWKLDDSASAAAGRSKARAAAHFKDLLASDANDFSDAKLRKHAQELRNKGKEIRKPIRSRREDDDTEARAAEVLLVLKILVSGDEGNKPGLRSRT
jgi:hypothetical protein